MNSFGFGFIKAGSTMGFPEASAAARDLFI